MHASVFHFVQCHLKPEVYQGLRKEKWDIYIEMFIFYCCSMVLKSAFSGTHYGDSALFSLIVHIDFSQEYECILKILKSFLIGTVHQKSSHLVVENILNGKTNKYSLRAKINSHTCALSQMLIILSQLH